MLLALCTNKLINGGAYVELKSVADPAFSGFNPIGRITAGAF
jgi:hypothetical protein